MVRHCEDRLLVTFYVSGKPECRMERRRMSLTASADCCAAPFLLPGRIYKKTSLYKILIEGRGRMAT